MLLCIDVGNTQTELALYPRPDDTAEALDPADRPRARWSARIRTERRATADELALTVRGMLGPLLAEVDGVAALSTVPALLRELRGMAEKHFPGVDQVLVEPGVRTGVSVQTDNPKEVGTDRICNTAAAHHLTDGAACIVVDFGTSTNFDCVSARGEFLGGALAPGIEISLDALAARAAQLRKVELVAPRSPIGKNTVESLQSGILYGFAGQVDGMVRRLRTALQPKDPDGVHVIATGGLASLVIDHSETVTRYEPELTLIGLRLIYERN